MQQSTGLIDTNFIVDYDLHTQQAPTRHATLICVCSYYTLYDQQQPINYLFV